MIDHEAVYILQGTIQQIEKVRDKLNTSSVTCECCGLNKSEVYREHKIATQLDATINRLRKHIAELQNGLEEQNKALKVMECPHCKDTWETVLMPKDYEYCPRCKGRLMFTGPTIIAMRES